MSLPPSGPVKWNARVTVVLVVFALLFLGVTGFLHSRRTAKATWVSEAQTAVEGLLHTADRIPAKMRDRLGAFQYLSGKGFAGAVWNIQGYQYLQADRDAHFDQGTIPVRIYITEGRGTNPGSEEVVVQKVERNLSSLFLIDAPLPKSPSEGLIIMVSHPDLE